MTVSVFIIYFLFFICSEIEQINDREKRSSSFLHLSLEFARVHDHQNDYTIVYFEKNGLECTKFQPYAELVCVQGLEGRGGLDDRG